MKTLTERGFADYAHFNDSYGSEVTVRESSSAEEPSVWIFCRHEMHREMHPHLTVDQAKTVRDALDEFIREHA